MACDSCFILQRLCLFSDKYKQLQDLPALPQHRRPSFKEIPVQISLHFSSKKLTGRVAETKQNNEKLTTISSNILGKDSLK